MDVTIHLKRRPFRFVRRMVAEELVGIQRHPLIHLGYRSLEPMSAKPGSQRINYILRISIPFGQDSGKYVNINLFKCLKDHLGLNHSNSMYNNLKPRPKKILGRAGNRCET